MLIAVCCLICLIIVGGIVCIIVAMVMQGTKSCEDLCGDPYKYDNNLGYCCTTQSGQDCEDKTHCGPWNTLLQVGLYIVGIPLCIACCIFGATRKRETTSYTTVQPKTRKFVIVEVDD